MSDNGKTPHKKVTKEQSDPSAVSLGKLDVVAIELRRAREAKGFSHTDLHRKTGISRPALFGYEAGRTKPGAKELRLLSKVLEVTPNRLLFGTEQPFKTRPGLRGIVNLRSSPAILLTWGMILIPVVFASLDEDQIDSILVILDSMVESRNKEAHKRITAMVEVLIEEIGNGTPEEISVISKRASDPDYLASISRRVEERIKDVS